MKQPFLFVALDGLSRNEKKTLKTAEQLSSVGGPNRFFGFKINLDYLLLCSGGLRGAIANVRQFGLPIFTDLKMLNGSRTMSDIIDTLVDLEVDFLNLYALADNLIAKSIKATTGTKTKVLGVTVLTHFNETYCQTYFRRSLKKIVRDLAETAINNGCDGIILPGTVLDSVADLNTIKVVPGIRPASYTDERHKEAIEPRIAKEKGADILVCGNPIMKSLDPVGVLENILSELV